MERINRTNEIWAEKVKDLRDNPDHVVSPRGMEVREQVGGQYTVPMLAYIDNDERKVNYDFMFAEMAWVAGGSNRLDGLTETMKSYANYSDDGVFLAGAYGPKIVDQYRYIVDMIAEDEDTRQAHLNIWRENPRDSKDKPCTTGMTFLVRDKKLNLSVYMRSHDIVLGATYDMPTFSAVANSVRLLLKERGLDYELGDLTVTAASMHLYERHYEKVEEWLEPKNINDKIGERVLRVMAAETYPEFIDLLKKESQNGEA